MEYDQKNTLIENQGWVSIKNIEDKKIAFDQYRIIVDSINSTNSVRESANNYWVTVNSLLFSAVAYLRGMEDIKREQHEVLIWSVLILGIGLCLFWLSSLISIKSYNNIRNSMLIEIERVLPAKVFTASYGRTQSYKNKRSLTIREMFVPCMFLIGYFIFMFLLIWTPRTVLGNS